MLGGARQRPGSGRRRGSDDAVEDFGEFLDENVRLAIDAAEADGRPAVRSAYNVEKEASYGD
ncbi:hypothetical protein ACWET9_37150 [Streptomyces sp. NPDC004059]